MTTRGVRSAKPAGSGRRDDPDADTLTLPLLERPRWRKRWPVLLVFAWAALAAVNIVLFGVGASPPKAGAAKTPAAPHVGATASASPAAVPSIQPSQSAIPVGQVLAPVSAVAYGPSGAGSGDNPGHAYEAIDASATTGWLTDWYASAAFGNLQTGTGLLIDMGRQVTITSIRIILGSTPGADLQILTGNVPARAEMVTEGSVSDAGASLSLNLAHTGSERYLLLWFSLLPPDSAGTFQASVYDVRLMGTS